MVAKSPIAILRRKQRDRLRNLQRDKKHRSDEHIKGKYGITLDHYDAMLAVQNGGCAICGATQAGRPGARRLFVDHDHATGELRGLLCHRCNQGIGAFNDDADLVEKAARYLRNPLRVKTLFD